MEKPLVSVIMPVYNGEKYIGKAIESVLAQNVPIELLVIDDFSRKKYPKVWMTIRRMP